MDKKTHGRLKADTSAVHTCARCSRAQRVASRSGGNSSRAQRVAQATGTKGAVDKKHALSSPEQPSPKRVKTQDPAVDAATTTTVVGALKETVSAGIRWFFG